MGVGGGGGGLGVPSWGPLEWVSPGVGGGGWNGNLHTVWRRTGIGCLWTDNEGGLL